MAHSLGMQVVAEGVEQHEQITRLISMGCEFGQGFFFSKPVSADEAERLVADMAGAGAADGLLGSAPALVASGPLASIAPGS
jgi:sensor c-di-GMP phosphodiesterase-like protein